MHSFPKESVLLRLGLISTAARRRNPRLSKRPASSENDLDSAARSLRNVGFLSVLAVGLGLLLVSCSALDRGRLPPRPVAGSYEPTLILISLDGFRWDYLDLMETPNLNKLAASGVRAEGLIPVFPSKTFPCHYSIVTGLYPGHHGIVSNNMYDRRLDAEFHLSDREAVEDPRWWGGEPIWVTAERQGMTAAAMFWPGTEAEIAGERPTYWHRFDKGFSYEARVAQVLEWLDLPAEKRPRLITLYFEDPNDTSHEFGAEAPETRAAVRRVDERVGDLLAGLEDRGLVDRVDLVVVSDHGMAEVGPERVVILDDYIELQEGEVFEEGAVLQIFPREGRTDKVYEALHDAHPSLAIYRREEIPERYHMQHSSRTPPILGVPDVGWEVVTRGRRERWGSGMLKGDHGQDPAAEDLHGLFIAAGPSFRIGLTVGRFENVEIYNLLTTVLGLDPAPNDGDPEKLAHILTEGTTAFDSVQQ
jgi:predicted AlkP superfamily pyrophosphatase or phosphodiesterase